MARPLGQKRNTMARSVIRLRSFLGMTQQQFAHKLNLAVTSVARYETNYPPNAEVLRQLTQIAQEANQPELASYFQGQRSPELDCALIAQEIEATVTEIERSIALFKKLSHPRPGLYLRQLRAAMMLIGSLFWEDQIEKIESAFEAPSSTILKKLALPKQ